jgi:hypothetical protein
MGTTLTGTTPQDTYDSLIKVTDNGPISGTAKYLSDGLGNDSALALSTARVGVGTNTPAEKLDVNGAIAFRAATASFASASAVGMVDQPTSGITRFLSFGPDVSTLGSFQFYTTGANNTGGVSPMTITNAGNVGIGTSVPDTLLHLSSATSGAILRLERNDITIVDGDSYGQVQWEGQDASTSAGGVRASVDVLATGSLGSTAMVFRVADAGAAEQERMRLTQNGLSFNGDTAAANALDDYEEGTWTMGVSFGGASVGVTTSNNTGTYTKIGRQVTVNGLLQLTSKGSSTGTALLTGLPFTIPASVSNYAAATLWFNKVSFLGQFSSIGTVSTTRLELWDTSSLGVITALTNSNFANDSEIMVNFTYFV